MPGGKEWLTGLLQRLRKALHGGSRHPQPVAVLIDGDGTSPHHADLVFAYARSLGYVSSAQLHSNFAALAQGMVRADQGGQYHGCPALRG